MKITTRKIAAKAGVSPASVSRYLNCTETVSEEIAGRIESAMQALGCGGAERRERKPVVLILLTHLRFAFYSNALGELLEQGRNGRYTLVLLQYDPGAPESVRRFARSMKPAGVIYFEEEIDLAILHELQSCGIRTVMCGGAALDCGSDMVHVNDIMAAYGGTQYLLDLGHKEILFLSDEVRKIGTGFQRITGSRKALEERGLEMSEGTVVYGAVTFEAGYEAVRAALARGRRFTAVFAFSDELAVGAMAALYDAGISVPEQISVLGYDDLGIASKIRPALTTIHQPIDGFIQKTLELFDQPAQAISSEILLQYSIQERESCRRISG